MINTTAIHTAITELLDGTIGTTRHMATSEYLSVDANDFTAWTPTGCTVIADQAYGANGEFTADQVTVTANDKLTCNLSTIPDNTVVTASLYAWSISSLNTTVAINIYGKDGVNNSSGQLTINSTKQKLSLSNVDVGSGGSQPTITLTFGANTAIVCLSECHITPTTYLFGKLYPWNDSVVSSGIDPVDGRLVLNTSYDIVFPHSGIHPATPVSSIGSHKIQQLDIYIELEHKLASNIQESERNTVRERVIYDGDRIMQAFSFPNNLSETADSTATGIISGMLTGLDHNIEREQWEESPPRIASRISGKALVHVTQPTS